MAASDYYSQAHLVVAAIRIFEHSHSKPPVVNDVCEILSFSKEQGHLLCKKLHESEIIEMVDGPHGVRLFVQDHLKIEDIPSEEAPASLQEEIERFQNTKKDFKEKIEAFQAKKADAQRDLFAQIEEKLKREITNE